MGEGLRNTINLRGPGAGARRLHWSSNFDEVQDFEGQIRALEGGNRIDDGYRLQTPHAQPAARPIRRPA